MGDFDEVVQLQAGIREWLLHAAGNGRHELRGIPARAVPPLLCAAAFGPALTEAAELDGAAAVARVGILSSVGADALGDVLAGALDRVRPGRAAGGLSPGDVQQEISRSVKEVLSARDPRAGKVQSDIAMVLREIDAGGTVFRAAIETGDEELQREALARGGGGERRVRRDGVHARRPGARGRRDPGPPRRAEYRAAGRKRAGRPAVRRRAHDPRGTGGHRTAHVGTRRAGSDGTVRLWDAGTQQQIGMPMTADAQPVYAAAFSPGAGTLATAGGDGTARTWNVAFPADLLQAACGIADVPFTPQQ